MRGRISIRELSRATGLPKSLVARVRRGTAVKGNEVRLAQAMGVHVQTVRRWRRQGVPAARVAIVAERLADIAAIDRAMVQERKNLLEQVKRARKANIMPRAKPKGTVKFGGARATGVRTVWHLNNYLSHELLQRIEELVYEAPKGPRYIVTVTAVEGGATGAVRGYGGKITPKLGPDAENVQFGSAITSGSWRNRQDALEKLFEKLSEAIDDADSIIFITDLLVFSYKHRTSLRGRD